jgi:pimeloyl-ACP methyl ester carboxylesterase
MLQSFTRKPEDQVPHPILDSPDILRVLFYPRRDEGLGYNPPGVIPLTIPVAPGVSLGARLYPAGSDSPAILFFHGNGEIASDYDDVAPLYTRLGITLLVADYRGYGTSGGTPTATSLLADAVALFDSLVPTLQDHGLVPSRLHAMGRSLGSAAAIEVAVHAGDRLAGLIVESGFSDTFALLRRMGLSVQGDEERDGFGNASKLSRVRAPTLIIHGREDRLIPAADGQELYRRSGAAGRRLLLIPGAGHNDILFVGLRAYMEAIRAFVHTPDRVEG